MSYRELFNRIQQALSSPEAYSSFQKEMKSKAVEQAMFNKLSGKKSFLGVVLPEDMGSTSATTENAKILRVRPIDLHDFMIPEPCKFKGDTAKIKRCISMHPVAYPDSSYSVLGGNAESPQAIGFGHIVECFFKDGPQAGGRMRGLTYKPKIVGTNPTGLDLTCISGENVDSTAGGAFNNGGQVPHVNRDSPFAGKHVLEKMERKINPSPNPIIGVGAPEVLQQATQEINFWADKYEAQAGKKGKTDKNHPVYRRVQLMQYYNLQMKLKDKGKPYRKVEEYYPNYVDDEQVKKTHVLAGQDSKTGFMHWSAVSISWIMRGSGFGSSSGHVYYALSIANGKREGWEVHSLLREKVKILVGDIVIKTRKEEKENGRYRLDASHGDVIYRISGNTAYTVGGNVDKPGVTGDRGWFGEIRKITLDSQGFLTNPGPYTVVLKKMR